MTQQIDQLTPRQAVARAKKSLNDLRVEYGGYQAARMATNAAAMGAVPNRLGMPPAQLMLWIEDMRDREATERAVRELQVLLQAVYQRPLSDAELSAGPPPDEALGAFLLPTIPNSYQVLAGVIFGAWSLAALFGYLKSREERLQVELGIPPARAPASVGTGAKAVGVLALLGAGGVAAYYGHRKWKEWRGGRPAPTAPREPTLPALPAGEDEEEGEPT